MAETTATTVAETTTHEVEPTSLGLNAEQWVWVGITIFLLLAVFVGKLPKQIATALDAKIADVRKQLDEAKALRAEAEALLAETRARQEAAGRDAAAILAHAKAEAEDLVKTAKADADALVERRTRMAEDKIGAAERAAAADLRARVATISAQAAKTVIAGQSTDADKSRLTDESIAALGRR